MKLRYAMAMALGLASAGAQVDPAAYRARWSHGPPQDTAFFPIAVWLQSPSNAARYKQAGINLYVGLWEGPTAAQLTQLAAAGMRVICEQNAAGLQDPASKTIVGWMHGDEPDNAQARPDGGYDPCVPTADIQAGYASMRARDSTRPVLLNLGRGVAVNDWVGRGTCTGKTDMYPAYAAGSDYLTFDVYPVNSSETAVRGNLWYVPKGVDSLRRWSGDAKPVWAWIETTRIEQSPADAPTPRQTRAEAWMALAHGATGIGYFCHSFYPSTTETACLADTAMRAGLTALNREIQGLAPVLNEPSAPSAASMASSPAGAPISLMAKRHGGAVYLFAVSLRPTAAAADFTVPGGAEAEVLGEGRRIALTDGRFHDDFAGYAVHLYRVSLAGSAVRDRRAKAARRVRGVSAWAAGAAWAEKGRDARGRRTAEPRGPD